MRRLSEYIEFLKDELAENGDRVVLLAGDNEGNSFHPITNEIGLEEVDGEDIIILYPSHASVEV